MNTPPETATLNGGVAILLFYLTSSLLLVLDYRTYLWLIDESGPSEWLGAMACLLAAVFFFVSYVRFPETVPAFSRWTERNPFVLALGLGSALLFLEEISWGQRLFGFETPALWSEINQQNEFNLHNISGIHDKAHQAGIAVLEVYFVLIPLLVYLSPAIRRSLESIGLPTADLQLAFFFLLSATLYRYFYTWLVWRANIQDQVNYGEVREVVIEIILLAFAVKHFLRSKEKAKARSPAPAH